MWRRVSTLPQVTRFKPEGILPADITEIRLLVEEAEAIRLRDLKGLEQEECAKQMSISRTTFSRILHSARQKIADAILTGKALRIEGGNFEMTMRRFKCIAGHEWQVPFETMIINPPECCPDCKTPSIMPIWPLGLGWSSSKTLRHQKG